MYEKESTAWKRNKGWVKTKTFLPLTPHQASLKLMDDKTILFCPKLFNYKTTQSHLHCDLWPRGANHISKSKWGKKTFFNLPLRKENSPPPALCSYTPTLELLGEQPAVYCWPRSSSTGTCRVTRLLRGTLVENISLTLTLPRFSFPPPWDSNTFSNLKAASNSSVKGRGRRSKRERCKGSEKENKKAVANFYHWPEINQWLLGMLAGEIDPFIYVANKIQRMEVKTGGWEGGGGVRVFHLFLSLWSDRGLDSRLYHPLWGSLTPASWLLSCLLFIVPVNPLCLVSFSLCQNSGGRAEAFGALSHSTVWWV